MNSDSEFETGDDVDPGEPIADLAAFEEETDAGFVPRLRGRINRRMLGAQAMDLSFKFFLDTVRDYVLVIFEIFQGPGRKGTKG